VHFRRALDSSRRAPDNAFSNQNLGELKMKKLLLGTAFALLATGAIAGSIAEPVMEPEVIIEQAQGSSVNHHILPPLIFVLSVGLGMALL
jgi:hypothetical protein